MHMRLQYTSSTNIALWEVQLLNANSKMVD